MPVQGVTQKSLSLVSLSFSSFLPTRCFLFVCLFLHPLSIYCFLPSFLASVVGTNFALNRTKFALNRVYFLKESITYPIPILSLTTWNMFLSFGLEANTAMFKWGNGGLLSWVTAEWQGVSSPWQYVWEPQPRHSGSSVFPYILQTFYLDFGAPFHWSRRKCKLLFLRLIASLLHQQKWSF